MYKKDATMNVRHPVRQNRNISSVGFLSWALFLSIGLQATTWALDQVDRTAPDAGTLLQQQQRQQQQSLTDVVLDRESRSGLTLPAPEPDAVSVEIREVRLTGPQALIEEAGLESLVLQAVGQRVDFKGLKFLSHWVTLQLRQQGYLLARATLPQQDVTDGVVQLLITEGHPDGRPGDLLEVQGEGIRISESRLEAMAGCALDPNDSVRQQDLERALLLMNDLPGLAVRSVLEPGQEDGTTRLKLKVDEDDPLKGMVWADNYGSRYSGMLSVWLAPITRTLRRSWWPRTPLACAPRLR